MRNKFIFVALFLSLVFNFNSALCEKEPVVPLNSIQSNKISLDIKGMDVIDVLKMLATRSGINIVVGKNVVGKVTLFIKDVSIEDAFDIVILANDLAYEKKGDIVNVMTQRDYEVKYGERFQDKKEAKSIQLKYVRAANLAITLNQIKSPIGRVVPDDASNTLFLIDTPESIEKMLAFIKEADLPLETRVFSLNYAQADKLTTKIQESVTKGVGSIKMDERTNKIAITDYPQKLDEIAKIISAFDEKIPQVLIDAQIIEIRPSDKLEMGVNWDYWINKYFETKAVLPINTTNTVFLGTTSATPAAPGDYKVIFDILRTIGDTKILSSPRIMALNNQEAKILVGEKDAYITSTTSQSGTGTTVTSQEVNFVDVGIKLYVTPNANRDNFVTMKIRPEISSAETKDIISEDMVTQVPIVSTSEAETTVVVKDGVTIIIGGLRKDERLKTTKRLPILGDLPWIGYLFGSTSDQVRKTDLVILLTPHIMSGESSYTDFSEIKPKNGAVASMYKGNIVTEKISEDKNIEEAATIYYKMVSEKVRATALSEGAAGQKGNVELAFTVANNGMLEGEPQVSRADNMNLVPFATKAIKDASPFTAFPDSLVKGRETFKISLSYQ